MKYVLKNNGTIFFLATVFFILLLAASIITERYYLLAAPFAVLLFYTGWTSFAQVFLLLIAVIPFSTEYQFSGNLGTDLPDEMLMLLVSGLALIALADNGTKIRRMISHPLLLILISTLLWSVIATMFSTHPLMSGKYLLAKGWYVGAFIISPLILWINRKSIRKTWLVFALSMLAVTLIVLVRHSLTGFSFAKVSDAVYPFFRNHVNYSSLLVCMLPVWFAIRQEISARRFKKLAEGVLTILLIALFFSYARGAWLALFVGITAYWLMKKRVIIRVMLSAFILLTIVLAWFAHNDRYLDFAPDQRTTIFHEDFREHLVATYEMTDMSAAERFYRWIAGIRMIQERPLQGFGPGTFYQNYKPYAVPAFETWVSDNPEHSTIHNYFLLTAVEQGIPGLFLLLILIMMIMYYAQHLFHRSQDAFYSRAAITTGVVFSMILTLNFLSDLVETDKIGSLFFLCIAMLITIDSKTGKQQVRTT